jgi:hypothetical protein
MSRKLRIGAMAPPIWEQFPDTGSEACHFELDAQAIWRLDARGILTSAERAKAEKRLFKSICSEIKRRGKLMGEKLR